MSTQQSEAATTRPLEILGIGEAEERAYRWLLRRSGATVSEAVQDLALAPGKTQRLLDAIEAKGLATHSPEHPRRYIPATPDIALKALALRRQQELQRVEETIQEMQEEAASQRRDEWEQIVELITNREAERQVFEHMQHAAHDEVVCLIRPPVLISRMDIPLEEDQSAQREAQARGVRYRSIVDTEFLGMPGTVDRVRSDIRAGEEIKVFPSLPFKLIMVDHRIGLIPLTLEEESKHFVLLVRSTPLLNALYALFEILWARAAPLSFVRGGALKTGDPGSCFPEATDKLIWLMAAGLNDKKIADELGISASTLKRRIAQLMQTFNARTRFQLGRLTERSFPGNNEK